MSSGMSNNNFLKNLWLWKCDKPEIEANQEIININDLFQSEWSYEFEQLCRNRLVMGALRYGKIHAPNKPNYDRTESILKRIYLGNYIQRRPKYENESN